MSPSKLPCPGVASTRALDYLPICIYLGKAVVSRPSSPFPLPKPKCVPPATFAHGPLYPELLTPDRLSDYLGNRLYLSPSPLRRTRPFPIPFPFSAPAPFRSPPPLA